jgi:hypothetical protein
MEIGEFTPTKYFSLISDTRKALGKEYPPEVRLDHNVKIPEKKSMIGSGGSIDLIKPIEFLIE